MNAVRERRLGSDYDALQSLCREVGPALTIRSATGSPPDTYTLILRCRSLVALDGEEARFGSEHHLRIYLPARYPAAAPVATMLTPIRNPHVWPNRIVCLGSWKMTEKLDSLVLRIASLLMLEPSALNLRSVADEEVVPWLQRHREMLPLDRAFRKTGTAS